MATPGIKFFKQKNDYFCGPAVVQMALNYFGIKYSQKHLARVLKTTAAHGTSQKDLIRFFRDNNFALQVGERIHLNTLKKHLVTAEIVIVNYLETSEDVGHYAIAQKIDKSFVHLIDPWHGPNEKVPLALFKQRWHNKDKSYRRWFLAIKPIINKALG